MRDRKRIRIRALLLALLGLGSLAASPGEEPGRPRGPGRNAPEKSVLATGVPWIYQRDTASPTTVVGLFIGGGKSAAPAGLDGLATIATRLLLELPDEGLVQALMAQATRLSYVCLEDGSIVLIECLTENLEQALRVAAKVIQDPLVSGLRVGRIKELMAVSGRTDEDDAVSAARSAVLRAFFGGWGYGSALFGTAESLKAIDRRDVLAFIRRAFVKPNIFFCVETDLDREPVRRLLESAFASIPDGPGLDPDGQNPIRPEDRDIRLVKESQQTYVGRAYPLPRADLADMAKGILLETLLGKGPGSRLWPLRADERLAYGADADLTWMKSAGILIAHLETGRARAAEAGVSLDRTLEALREAGIDEAEMAATRTMARARVLRDTEMKTPRLRTLGLFELLGLGAAALPGLGEAFDAVSRAEFNAYVREALSPERVLRVTVGPPPDDLAKGEPSCPD